MSDLTTVNGDDEAGPSRVAPSPKDSASLLSEGDNAGEMNCINWVVDNSGFLSPAGPVLREVLDMVDGVGKLNIQAERRI